MKKMVSNGETEYLVAERVWAELYKALCEKTPSAFFYTLKECNALQSVFPEIDKLFGVPQPEKHHPEIDTGIHIMLCLEQAVKLSNKPEVRLAALLHDLGKAETDKSKWPSHHGHEQLGLPVLEQFCSRLRVPKAFKTLSTQVMLHHTHCHRAFELKASTLTDLLASLGVFKPSHSIVDDFLLACEADSKGRTGLENKPYPQAVYIKNASLAASAVDTSEILSSKLKGSQIGDAIRQLRIKAVAEFIKSV
jgi:tRNA nucleotidyltransferase (CCA-adding enzyme)